MPPHDHKPQRNRAPHGSKREPSRPQEDERSERPPLPPGIGSRDASLDLLRLTTKGRTLDQALDECRSFAALEGSDRGFARALASTTLRRRGTLDEVIATYLREPLKPRQAHLRDILRITAAQLCLMDTEAHAAAWSAVELAKLRAETKGYTGLVNAVARRLTETGKDKAAKAELRLDTPGWLWRSLARTYGAKTASAIAEAHRHEAALDITLRNPEVEIDWPEELGARRIGPSTVRMGTARVQELPGYDEGQWWVQDLAATLPATVLGVTPGERVYDLCAAPGGKTMQLAAAGADVFAVDISGPRLVRTQENLERTGLSAALIDADVLKWTPPQRADRILLDAPCTATGTIRRNPDLLWTAKEDLLSSLKTLQSEMLDQAANLLAPGGTLVYATCSLLPEEGEQQIERALARHPELTRLPIDVSEIAGLPVVNKDGDIRCLPHMMKADGGIDGFFVARLKKADG